MGVVFTSEAAKRIAAAVRRVEAMPQERTGERTPPGPIENDIWGWITGLDASGLRYSFVRVIPDAGADEPDLILTNGMRYRLYSDDPLHIHVAREVNGTRGIASGTIVRMSFAGYDADGEAAFVFQYQPPQPPSDHGLHDHRDNITGRGFSFSVYHPGTALPQQPWAR